MWPEIMHIPFHHRRAVYIDLLIDQPDVIARNSNHPLYKMQPGIEWIMKNHDIAAFYLAIWQKLAAKVAGAEVQFVHQQVIARQQRILHGFRRDLECLHDECHYKNSNDDNAQQPLQRFWPV